MLSQRVKNNLDAMMQAPGFQVTRSGDTFFATAPGFRKKKLMGQGAVTTPIGQWMRDMRMLPLQPDRVDTTRPTEFRGNSEYALTQSGKRVKLRDTRGLTHRGKQVYQTPELTVEVPATQEGVNASGEQFQIETVKIYTEVEFPEMGELFRQQPTQEQGMRAVVNLFKSRFEDDDFMLEESAQVWRYDAGRDFVFRIRRRVGNELQVQRLAMLHEQPLRYDWLHTTGMLPEALEIGGKCVTRQVAALLGFPERIAADLQASWEKCFEYCHMSPEPPKKNRCSGQYASALLSNYRNALRRGASYACILGFGGYRSFPNATQTMNSGATKTDVIRSSTYSYNLPPEYSTKDKPPWATTIQRCPVDT